MDRGVGVDFTFSVYGGVFDYASYVGQGVRKSEERSIHDRSKTHTAETMRRKECDRCIIDMMVVGASGW